MCKILVVVGTRTTNGPSQDFNDGAAQTMVWCAKHAGNFGMPTFGASPTFNWPHPTLSQAPYSAECKHILALRRQ